MEVCAHTAESYLHIIVSIAYALEGSAFIAGSAVKWLRDGLRFVKEAYQIEDLAKQVCSRISPGETKCCI